MWETDLSELQGTAKNDSPFRETCALSPLTK